VCKFQFQRTSQKRKISRFFVFFVTTSVTLKITSVTPINYTLVSSGNGQPRTRTHARFYYGRSRPGLRPDPGCARYYCFDSFAFARWRHIRCGQSLNHCSHLICDESATIEPQVHNTQTRLHFFSTRQRCSAVFRDVRFTWSNGHKLRVMTSHPSLLTCRRIQRQITCRHSMRSAATTPRMTRRSLYYCI